jgi:UDP-glucose 4-epimerase
MVGPISEASPPDPLSDYAIAHYAAEQVLKRCSRQGVDVLILRPNAVFGVPVDIDRFDRWSLIPFSFPLEAVYKQEIVLLTSGVQRRNFISSEDLAAHVEKFLTAGSTNSFEVINPIGPETLSIYEFAQKCASTYTMLTGTPCQIKRPESHLSDGAADFTFASLNREYKAVHQLDEYLVLIIKRILGDLENDRRHGS